MRSFRDLNRTARWRSSIYYRVHATVHTRFAACWLFAHAYCDLTMISPHFIFHDLVGARYAFAPRGLLRLPRVFRTIPAPFSVRRAALVVVRFAHKKGVMCVRADVYVHVFRLPPVVCCRLLHLLLHVVRAHRARCCVVVGCVPAFAAVASCTVCTVRCRSALFPCFVVRTRVAFCFYAPLFAFVLVTYAVLIAFPFDGSFPPLHCLHNVFLFHFCFCIYTLHGWLVGYCVMHILQFFVSLFLRNLSLSIHSSLHQFRCFVVATLRLRCTVLFTMRFIVIFSLYRYYRVQFCI